MGPKPAIVLIGPRGAGKTTIGVRLAETRRGPLIDTDALISTRAGATIAEIVQTHGEAHFRSIEAAVVAELPDHPAAVISVGGGAVLDPENRRILRTLGVVVWLDAPADVLWARLAVDPLSRTQRPPLTNDPPREELVRLCALREPLYRELADVRVCTADTSPAQVAEAVLRSVATLAKPQ